jgi:hypothetical protein
MCMIHVLEHVFSPGHFLVTLQEKLKPYDLLFIDVPNVCEYNQISEIHIAHLYHFNITTLARYVSESGFKILKIEEHEPPHHPKSIRLICEVIEYNKGNFNSLPDTNMIDKRDKILLAFKRVNNSKEDYFSSRSLIKRKVKRYLSLAKRFFERGVS